MEGSSSNGVDPPLLTSIPEGSTVPTNSTTDALCNDPTSPSVENEESTLYNGTDMESNASMAPSEDAQSAFLFSYTYPLCLL
eukprot:14635319-Ditylum_brightwellii.AAC.1